MKKKKKMLVGVWIYRCSGNVVTQSHAENSRGILKTYTVTGRVCEN